MKQVAILVEGQTEEQFVDRVLQPYLNPDGDPAGFWLQPIIVTTSRTPAGLKFRGGGKWKHYDVNLPALGGPLTVPIRTLLGFEAASVRPCGFAG